MIITWEQLGKPTESGVYNVDGVGTVVVTNYDLRFSGKDEFDIELTGTGTASAYKIRHWVTRKVTVLPSEPAA